MKKVFFFAGVLLALFFFGCQSNETETAVAVTEAAAQAVQTAVPTAAPTATPTPTPIPTATPIPTPVPITDEQLDAGYVDGWFQDSVLVGDSLVAGLLGFMVNERFRDIPCLDDMKLVGASAMTLKKALEGETGLRPAEFKLQKYYMSISEIVTTLNAKRLFIMLGVNDLRWYSAEEFIDTYDQLIQAVRANHPDLEIHIHSIMPMVEEYAGHVDLTAQQNIELNDMLEAYCLENGFGYIELSDRLRDENGYLVYEYSADDYRFHLNKAGKVIWIRCLREYAREEYNRGNWSPN